VAGASPQAGAVANPGQESVAVFGHEPRTAVEVETVDAKRTAETGSAAVRSLRGATAGHLAGAAGPTGTADHQPGYGGAPRSRSATRRGTADDSSRSRAGDQLGVRSHAGPGGTICWSAPSGQLLRTDSARALQRRQTAIGRHQQAGQFVSA